MPESVSKTEAEKILISSFKDDCIKDDQIKSDIEKILRSSHKTYKYVLITGLLAKATNEKINALALQAGSDLDGAYDARSLCHNVLVPFEREFLQNALGGSNEPFLNKPARFTHLSESNAVRKGDDRIVLSTLIKVLTATKNSIDAKSYLACALKYLNKIIDKNKENKNSIIKFNPTLIEVYEFIINFVSHSFEGETSAIIVGALEKLYFNQFNDNYRIKVHKVNQSGSSSKEIGDIDIFKAGKYLYSIEVKDKKFTSFDLEHAMRKISEAGGTKGQFIYGPQASFDEHLINTEIAVQHDKGFMVLCQDIYMYSKSILIKLDLKNKQDFIDSVFETASEINCRSQTLDWIQSLLLKFGWK